MMAGLDPEEAECKLIRDFFVLECIGLFTHYTADPDKWINEDSTHGSKSCDRPYPFYSLG